MLNVAEHQGDTSINTTVMTMYGRQVRGTRVRRGTLVKQRKQQSNTPISGIPNSYRPRINSDVSNLAEQSS